MEKAIMTVIGKDQVGIIAKVCTYLSQSHINILDISQTIMQEYFTMMMVVDVTNFDGEFADIADNLEELGENIGVKIKLQHADIFDKMHRI